MFVLICVSTLIYLGFLLVIMKYAWKNQATNLRIEENNARQYHYNNKRLFLIY